MDAVLSDTARRLEVEEANPSALFALGRAAQRAGRPDQALSYFCRAISAEPNGDLASSLWQTILEIIPNPNGYMVPANVRPDANDIVTINSSAVHENVGRQAAVISTMQFNQVRGERSPGPMVIRVKMLNGPNAGRVFLIGAESATVILGVGPSGRKRR